MNIKGNARGGPRALARHLYKDENEVVRVIGSHGFAAKDVEGALIEMDALGAGLRTDKTLYHGIISPAQGKDFAMTAADWEFTRKAWLKGMGFENQPYLEVEHEKFGKDGILRRHRHIIVPTADARAGYTRAISTSHNYRKHEEIARDCERQLGHEHVQGAHVSRFGVERPKRTPTVAEMRAAERGGVSAKEAKTLGAEIWRTSDSGKAINAALAAQGWQLARGDKQRADGGAYFMAIDPAGEVRELRRMMPVKAAELYARMADIDPANLPSVTQAKAMQRERQPEREAARAERETRAAAKDRVDDARGQRATYFPALRPNERRASTRQPNRPPKVPREFAREVVGRGERSAAPSAPGQTRTRTTEPQRAAQPQKSATAELAKTGRAAEKTAGKGAGIFGRIVTALGLGAIFGIGDRLFPAPPPSPEQQQRNHQAAKEQQATDELKAAKEAYLRQLLERMARDDQERARRARERGGRDDDYGGRERER